MLATSWRRSCNGLRAGCGDFELELAKLMQDLGKLRMRAGRVIYLRTDGLQFLLFCAASTFESGLF